MPALANSRHEAFARALVEGKAADEAYVIAGYKKNSGNAATLKGNQSVLERVAELRESAAAKAEVTVASLLDELEEARQLALKINQPTAAVAATKERGILSGLRVEKRENINRNLNEMSDDELAAIASGSSSSAAGEAKRPPLAH